MPKTVTSLSARRAWIEINVLACSVGSAWSLSARRAWIEIGSVINGSRYKRVALRKESVDRNIFPPADTSSVNASLSARRAWIEMTQCKL